MKRKRRHDEQAQAPRGTDARSVESGQTIRAVRLHGTRSAWRHRLCSALLALSKEAWGDCGARRSLRLTGYAHGLPRMSGIWNFEPRDEWPVLADLRQSIAPDSSTVASRPLTDGRPAPKRTYRMPRADITAVLHPGLPAMVRPTRGISAQSPQFRLRLPQSVNFRQTSKSLQQQTKTLRHQRAIRAASCTCASVAGLFGQSHLAKCAAQRFHVLLRGNSLR